MKAPFPYPGGKSRVAHIVWERFGNPDNYVEPFAGSLAVLLARPKSKERQAETVNDLNGYIANFWRSVKQQPAEVAELADYPSSHVDLHARQNWLIARKRTLVDELLADPFYCDPRAAAWWVWGISNWIGSGWCEEDEPREFNTSQGVMSARPHLGAAQGVMAKRPHLGDAGQGVMSARPHLGDAGQGVMAKRPHLGDVMEQLAARLHHVRILCGDWTRATRGVLNYGTQKAVFLDPPYDPSTLADSRGLYSGHHSSSVSADVREWAIHAAGENPNLRICLAGYEDEHGPHMPDTWEVVKWSSTGMQATANSQSIETRHKERLWFSPNCRTTTLQLF